MPFLVPFALALGLTLPIVVIFYLLKVKRRDEEVSSTFLWADLVRDLAAHEPLQKLRWNVLMAIQLLLLALLTLALARPFMERIGESPVHAVLLLDASASMQATDVSPSRWAAAVELARETVTDLPENSLATVVLASTHPQVLVSSSSDRRAVDRALTEARPSGASGNIREALLLARSLGGDPASRRIHVFTDGAFTLAADLPEDLGQVDVRQVASAQPANLAVTTISSRPDPADNRRRQLFARVENFSDEAAQSRLMLEVDGQAVEQRDVNLQPNGSLDQVFENLPQGARSARVTVEGGPAASFALDDSGYSVLAESRPSQVLLVTAANPFLKKALTLFPGVDLFEVQPRRYLTIEADRYDIVVFDGYLPPILPRGNLLVVNPPDRGPVRVTGQIVSPRIAGWEVNDPLLSFVNVRDLAVNRAMRLESQPWLKPLITTTQGYPLMAAGQDGDRRMAILPFDLAQSSLPRATAFPILMANFVSYLAPPGIVRSHGIATGEPETLLPLPQAERLRVIAPDQQVQDLAATSSVLTYSTTDQPGVYRVQQFTTGGGQTVEEDLFAANISERAESDLRPRMPAQLGDGFDLAEALVPIQNELWGLLAALALPLLMFEWFWFHRRV